MNSLSYRNPAADGLIEAARAEPNEEKRVVLFHALHALVHEDEPATWIGQIAVHHAVNRRVEGVVTSPLGLFRFWPGACAWYPKTRE
jgi:ABC-type transport system substrate-binding protein